MAVTPRQSNGRFQQLPPSTQNLGLERSAAQRPPGWTQNAPGACWGGYEGFGGRGLEGSGFNPIGFTGYGAPYSGSYEQYRWILQHPIVRLVRSIAVGPILSSTWEYGPTDKKVPEDWIELVKNNLDPLRSQLLSDFFVNGRDYGHACGEPIWETTSSQRNGETRLVRVKPLLHDVTKIRSDPHGNFTGVENYVAVEGQDENPIILAAPYKAFLYTYDSYAGYLYGRSWLENIRATAWADWMNAAQQLNKLGMKVSDTFLVVKTPSGTYPGPNGTRISYRDSAIELIADAASGAPGAWLPSLALNVNESGEIDALKMMAELASKSLTSLEALDFGSHSAAIKGLLERMVHDEELMFAGGLRPSRSGLEGEHGTKSSAEVHTDTGTTNAEIEDSAFAVALQPLVDAILVVNRGEIARGRVRINPPPLVARLLATVKALLLAGMNDPDVAVELMGSMDVNNFCKILGIKQTRPFSQETVVAAKQQAAANPTQNPRPGNVDPQGGRPPTQG